MFSTEGKGWAVRSIEYLPKGSFICEYIGEILTNTELYERNKQSRKNERHTYPVYLDADWGSEQVLKDEEALCLDATNYGNVARFINHRYCTCTLQQICDLHTLWLQKICNFFVSLFTLINIKKMFTYFHKLTEISVHATYSL